MNNLRKYLLAFLLSVSLLGSGNAHAITLGGSMQELFRALSLATEEHPTVLRFDFLDSSAVGLRRAGMPPASCERVSAGGVSAWLEMMASGLLEEGCNRRCQKALVAFSSAIGASDLDRCVSSESDAYGYRDVIEYRSTEGSVLFGFEVVLSN